MLHSRKKYNSLVEFVSFVVDSTISEIADVESTLNESFDADNSNYLSVVIESVLRNVDEELHEEAIDIMARTIRSLYERTEPLEELSTDLLKRYTRKAKSHLRRIGTGRDPDPKNRWMNREDGIQLAYGKRGKPNPADDSGYYPANVMAGDVKGKVVHRDINDRYGSFRKS